MTTLQERITALEEEIAEYRQEYVNAITVEEKKMCADLITERTKPLNALLQQQLLQQQGEFVPVTSTSLL